MKKDLIQSKKTAPLPQILRSDHDKKAQVRIVKDKATFLYKTNRTLP